VEGRGEENRREGGKGREEEKRGRGKEMVGKDEKEERREGW
jgi:hypothetical protein